ncbi:hypothetical protein FKP32DRAFT_1759206 [Trametes sanguinea]|nr:hypothetical protein FKP32DRAFT_1759206 [Trametes sanguinea]
MEQARDKALAEHAGYWQQYPGHYEHWRFAEGFARGWDDAYLFARMAPPRSGSGSGSGSTSAEEIGFVGPWTRRRAQEHVAQEGGGGSVWEFEHGFKQGLRAATSELAIAA